MQTERHRRDVKRAVPISTSGRHRNSPGPDVVARFLGPAHRGGRPVGFLVLPWWAIARASRRLKKWTTARIAAGEAISAFPQIRHILRY